MKVKFKCHTCDKEWIITNYNKFKEAYKDVFECYKHDHTVVEWNYPLAVRIGGKWVTDPKVTEKFKGRNNKWREDQIKRHINERKKDNNEPM